MFSVSCSQNRTYVYAPSDPYASARTASLYCRLFSLMDKGVMLGHQDDLAYGYQNYAPGFSDVKDVAGDYPAVIGWELGHIELGAEYSLDSVYFDNIRNGIVETDSRGGLNTISWHCDNILTGGSTWDCKRNDVVRSILQDQEKRSEYLRWLNRLGDFLKSLKDVDGECVPVVLRLYHEQTSSWFWWGAEQCSAEDYISMWRMTVEHLRNYGVHNVLIAYSPSNCKDEQAYLERYPGDDYVDVVGFDVYQYGDDEIAKQNYVHEMTRNIEIVTAYAEKAHKLPIVAETGWEGIKQNDYFTSVILPLLQPYKLSWVLFWRNAWEPSSVSHFYLPYQGHESMADFNLMIASPKILMNKDIEG